MCVVISLGPLTKRQPHAREGQFQEGRSRSSKEDFFIALFIPVILIVIIIARIVLLITILNSNAININVILPLITLVLLTITVNNGNDENAGSVRAHGSLPQGSLTTPLRQTTLHFGYTSFNRKSASVFRV